MTSFGVVMTGNRNSVAFFHRKKHAAARNRPHIVTKVAVVGDVIPSSKCDDSCHPAQHSSTFTVYAHQPANAVLRLDYLLTIKSLHTIKLRVRNYPYLCLYLYLFISSWNRL